MSWLTTESGFSNPATGCTVARLEFCGNVGFQPLDPNGFPFAGAMFTNPQDAIDACDKAFQIVRNISTTHNGN